MKKIATFFLSMSFVVSGFETSSAQENDPVIEKGYYEGIDNDRETGWIKITAIDRKGNLVVVTSYSKESYLLEKVASNQYQYTEFFNYPFVAAREDGKFPFLTLTQKQALKLHISLNLNSLTKEISSFSFVDHRGVVRFFRPTSKVCNKLLRKLSPSVSK